MVCEADVRAALDFLHLEARLADEGRYAEGGGRGAHDRGARGGARPGGGRLPGGWALWTDDAVYWVPATTDPAADPDKHLSHIYDNRARLGARLKMRETRAPGSRAPPSLMPPLIGNVEVRDGERGELVTESNFILGELAVPARHEMHWWGGRATQRLRGVECAL